jgi:CheY-like chemotaxis protein
VDIRADVYGLGGLLHWCLTGKPPFHCHGDLPAYLARRQTQSPTPLRELRPDAPAGLEAVLERMLALRAEDRYATPREVIRALLPFVQVSGFCKSITPTTAGGQGPTAPVGPSGRRVLIVDDEDGLRRYCKLVLQAEGLECDEAANGRQAMAATAARDYDLVLLDYNLPDTNGAELLRAFRSGGEAKHRKVIMMSGGVRPTTWPAPCSTAPTTTCSSRSLCCNSGLGCRSWCGCSPHCSGSTRSTATC